MFLSSDVNYYFVSFEITTVALGDNERKSNLILFSSEQNPQG